MRTNNNGYKQKNNESYLIMRCVLLQQLRILLWNSRWKRRQNFNRILHPDIFSLSSHEQYNCTWNITELTIGHILWPMHDPPDPSVWIHVTRVMIIAYRLYTCWTCINSRQVATHNWNDNYNSCECYNHGKKSGSAGGAYRPLIIGE